MHNLVGVYIREEPEEILPNGGIVYPFKLIFPPNKGRTYFLLSKQERDDWVYVIKKSIGYSNIEDYYEIRGDLGKGKFGLVKLATHKKTGKFVAIKVIRKKDLKLKELELQKREIEVLKICQHPNIIRLLDVFENPEYIYIGKLFLFVNIKQFLNTQQGAIYLHT